jgi:hypothetical protein
MSNSLRRHGALMRFRCERGLHRERLLYLLSIASESKNGKPPSKQMLFNRVRSTIREMQSVPRFDFLSVVLFLRQLGIELRRVGKRKRLTFVEGEQRLSQWMAENAFVTWMEPWNVEKRLISTTCLPLNRDQNSANPYHRVLSEQRKAAKARARELPIWTGAG